MTFHYLYTAPNYRFYIRRADVTYNNKLVDKAFVIRLGRFMCMVIL